MISVIVVNGLPQEPALSFSPSLSLSLFLIPNDSVGIFMRYASLREFPRSNENRKMLETNLPAFIEDSPGIGREEYAEKFVSNILRFAPEWRNLRERIQAGSLDEIKRHHEMRA